VAVPAPHPWRTKGDGLDGVARRAVLAFVSAPQVLLDSGVGGAGVDEVRETPITPEGASVNQELTSESQ
jgi:hypothetical protein